MATLGDALHDYLARLAVGDEREIGTSTYLETTGKETVTVEAREVLVRESPSIVLRVRTAKKGNRPVERYEQGRYAERELHDTLLAEPRLCTALGLPAPEESDVIDRTVERLREGHVFAQGGSDDGGGHSGRGISAETRELRFRDGAFVFEVVELRGAYGETPVEVARETITMDEAKLRAELGPATCSSRGTYSSLRMLLALPLR